LPKRIVGEMLLEHARDVESGALGTAEVLEQLFPLNDVFGDDRRDDQPARPGSDGR